MVAPAEPTDSYGYVPADLARRVDEPDKAHRRPAFRRDRARVLHSWALRRLADKTQVLLPGQSDFPRTRLTHTLEVAQVAREMGAELGCDPDLTETAGLCHDLGHPPFGHNGESALQALAVDIGGFEGNAQSFRVLTRLEPKIAAVGLNLTRASLDAMIKYPWTKRADTTKFNVYVDDLPAFDWVRQSAPIGTRTCLESQVMDWADDVAYSVHDIEDAFYSGYLSPQRLTDDPGLNTVLELAAQADDVSLPDAEAALERLQHLPEWPSWPSAFDYSSASLASLKALTSTLIGRFSAAAVDATRDAAGTGPLTRYACDLQVPRSTRGEVAVLKAAANHFVFNRPGAHEVYRAQRDMLTELAEALLENAGADLHPMFAEAWQAATGDGERLRVVVDQVASLTDVSAMRWHDRLVGSRA